MCSNTLIYRIHAVNSTSTGETKQLVSQLGTTVTFSVLTLDDLERGEYLPFNVVQHQQQTKTTV